MKYPIGIQTFEKIRTQGYVYIDKTALVYRLATDPRKLIKVGVRFGSESKGIDGWKVVE